jgi:hypothetical protein
MILHRLRPGVALFFLVLAAAGAGPGVSRAATVSSPPPSARQGGRVGQIGIKLLQVPANEAGDLRAQLYIIDRLAPGAVIHRKFEVSNLGSAAAHLTVYPAAATISNGGFRFAAGHTQNEMTTWVSVSQGALTLASHSHATLVATVAVPRDAPPGERYGVIWAEVGGGGTGNVRLVTRAGIRLYLSIGPGGAPDSAFTLGPPVTSRTSAGGPVVRVPVHNTGGRAVDVRGALQLSDGPGGASAGPFSASAVLTIAPGQSGQDVFELSPHLPDGPWQGTFTMVSGLITKTETVTLDFTGGPASAARSPFPVVPVVAGLALLVGLAATALLITRARRTRRVGIS